jgi:hypothetical protein
MATTPISRDMEIPENLERLFGVPDSLRIVAA